MLSVVRVAAIGRASSRKYWGVSHWTSCRPTRWRMTRLIRSWLVLRRPRQRQMFLPPGHWTQWATFQDCPALCVLIPQENGNGLRHVSICARSCDRAGRNQVFFLKAGPGVKLLPHAHTGIEMTCVLAGSFRHDGGYYGAGDFDLGDSHVDHQISIGSEEYCICLVAMQGELRLKGLFGRLMQPFVSI